MSVVLYGHRGTKIWPNTRENLLTRLTLKFFPPNSRVPKFLTSPNGCASLCRDDEYVTTWTRVQLGGMGYCIVLQQHEIPWLPQSVNPPADLQLFPPNNSLFHVTANTLNSEGHIINIKHSALMFWAFDCSEEPKRLQVVVLFLYAHKIKNCPPKKI